MASLDEKPTEDTTQDDGANASKNPRVQALVDDIAEKVTTVLPAKRKRDKMDDQDKLQDPLQTAAEEDDNISSVDPRDNQAEEEAAMSKSDSREEETGGVKKPVPLESGAASKPSQVAAKDALKSDAVSVPDLKSEYGIGEVHKLHPEPAPVYEVGGRQLRARARRPAPRNQKPSQKRQNARVTNPSTVDPKQQAQTQPGSSISNTNLTTKTDPATNANPTPDQPDHPPTRPGIDTPHSPPATTAIPTTQAPSVRVHHPQFAAAVASIIQTRMKKNTLKQSGRTGTKDSGPNEQQQVENRTSGLRGDTETGGNSDDRNSRKHRNSKHRERDNRTGSARSTKDTNKDTNRDTSTGTDGDRKKERERDKRKKRRERTLTITSERSRSYSPRLSSSPGSDASVGGPLNTILACLPPNTPIEILRCLEKYHQTQADDLRLEHKSISKNRTARALREPEGAGMRDNNEGQGGRDRGSPSILACLDPIHSRLETMRQLGLHYQFQADELRLECVRVEKEERERKSRHHRERE